MSRRKHRLRLRFEVEDTGPGIAPEDQERIFEPFVQAGKSSVQKGTGLGLAISRRFVEMMGGTLGVESAPGGGSRFTVELPAEPASQAEIPSVRAGGEHLFALEAGGPERRVLVVDDTTENAMLLERMLTRAGFQVRLAPNGERGIEVFQEWRPHFIWMDVKMPGIGGLEAARRIRRLHDGGAVKIAALSASVFESERGEVLEAGIDDFISKPFRPEEVFLCMARHLGLRYRSAEAAVKEREEEHRALRPEGLAAVSSELRRELADAVVSLNQARIFAAVDRLEKRDEALATILRRLTANFNFTQILQALERAEAEAAGSGSDKIKA